MDEDQNRSLSTVDNNSNKNLQKQLVELRETQKEILFFESSSSDSLDKRLSKQKKIEYYVKALSEQASQFDEFGDNKSKVVGVLTNQNLIIDSLIETEESKDTIINEVKTQRTTKENKRDLNVITNIQIPRQRITPKIQKFEVG